MIGSLAPRCHSFWVACIHFFNEHLYRFVVRVANPSQFHLFVTYTFVFHQILFWFWSAIFGYVDVKRSPSFLYRYKIQEEKYAFS